MHFKLLSPLSEIELIARGTSLRVRARLNRLYGQGKWRKRKGVARIELEGGRIVWAELHWYEATGIGQREMKIKRLLFQR